VIRLTHLNGREFYFNSDLLQCLEITPDTLLVMTTGGKILVKEKPEQVLDRIVEFKRRVYGGTQLTIVHNEAPEPPASEEA